MAEKYKAPLKAAPGLASELEGPALRSATITGGAVATLPPPYFHNSLPLVLAAQKNRVSSQISRLDGAEPALPGLMSYTLEGGLTPTYTHNSCPSTPSVAVK